MTQTYTYAGGVLAYAQRVVVDGTPHTKARLVEFSGTTAPAVAPAGKARTYFDSSANKLKLSENGGAYGDFGSGGGGTDLDAEYLLGTASSSFPNGIVVGESQVGHHSLIVTNNQTFNDNSKAYFGTGNDASIYSDGINGYFDATGNWVFLDNIHFQGDTIDSFAAIFAIDDPSQERTYTFTDQTGTVLMENGLLVEGNFLTVDASGLVVDTGTFGLTGEMSGPDSVTADKNVAIYDGTSGKILQDSGCSINAGIMTCNGYVSTAAGDTVINTVSGSFFKVDYSNDRMRVGDTVSNYVQTTASGVQTFVGTGDIVLPDDSGP